MSVQDEGFGQNQPTQFYMGSQNAAADKAFQSVSQSAAIAVQDAADQLRNINSIGLSSAGVAMAEMLASGDVERYEKILDKVNTLMQGSSQNFRSVGDTACNILNQFSSKNC